MAIGQESAIDTDRPDQTESAFLVPKQFLQFELGFTFTEFTKDEHELLIPTLLSKYGLSKNIELRLLTTYVSTSHLLIPMGTIYDKGFAPVEVGTKLALLQQKKWVPQTAVIVQFGIPHLASAKYKINKLATSIVFVLQNALSKNFALGYNFGAEWDGIDNRYPYYIYTFSPGWNFAGKWYGYVEAFGTLKKYEPAQHNLDGGIAYYLSNDCKIDFSSGFGITKASALWYAAVGFSIRCKLKNH